MSRIPPAAREQYVTLFGDDASRLVQVYAQAPNLAKLVVDFLSAARDQGTLDPRLIELVRLRVAFFNQCRMCMATRYGEAIDAGLTEDLVCSLERPTDAEDLTEPERAAVLFAEQFATDHLSIGDATFAQLRSHFTDPEVMELCFRVAAFVGFGRMTAVLDIVTDELPDRFREEGAVSPWGEGPVLRSGGVAGKARRAQ